MRTQSGVEEKRSAVVIDHVGEERQDDVGVRWVCGRQADVAEVQSRNVHSLTLRNPAVARHWPLRSACHDLYMVRTRAIDLTLGKESWFSGRARQTRPEREALGR